MNVNSKKPQFDCMISIIVLAILHVILIGTFVNGQDLEIYDTKYGIKNITPSIIIDENSTTGDYKVYSVSKYGLRNITPDAVIENNEYLGTWKVYRVSDYGVKDFIPSMEAKENDFNGNVKIYDVSEYGIKNISPSEIIRKQGNQYNVYSVDKYGLKDISPSRIIEVKEQPTVFGIVLLPSIKKITFDPGHSKLKAIKRYKELSDSLSQKEGWRSSKKKKESKED